MHKEDLSISALVPHLPTQAFVSDSQSLFLCELGPPLPPLNHERLPGGVMAAWFFSSFNRTWHTARLNCLVKDE